MKPYTNKTPYTKPEELNYSFYEITAYNGEYVSTYYEKGTNSVDAIATFMERKKDITYINSVKRSDYVW